MKKLSSIFLLMFIGLYAEEPWLTGSLLAPQAITVKKGALFIDPYLYIANTYGTYTSDWKTEKQAPFYTYNFQPIFYYGITSYLDIELSLQLITNQTRKKSYTSLGDTYIAFDYQLYRNDSSAFPAVKLSIGETFPSGKYQDLNPRKFKTDATGKGSYASTLGVVFYKVYHLRAHHFLSTNFAIDYTLSTPVKVHQYNTYGGGIGTKGKIKPGNIFSCDLSFEWTFNQHWEITLDNVYIHSNSSKFSGNKGNTTQIGLPSSESLSFAVALGYNFSANLGLMAGYWFTAIGRNTQAFRSGAIEFLWTL